MGDLWLFVRAEPGSIVEAEVSGDDMESPILADLDLEGNTASAIIEEVEEGESREILISAFGPNGRSCSEVVTVAVRAGEITKIEGPPLACVDPSRQTTAREERGEPLPPVAAVSP